MEAIFKIEIVFSFGLKIEFLSVNMALFTNDNVRVHSHQVKAKAKIFFAISLILFACSSSGNR